MAGYSTRVMEHFANPRNVGEIEDPSGVGDVGNPVCGDIMRMYIKVEDGIITDAKFKTFGCGAAIATSSMATELVKGKSIDEALKLTNRAVAEALEGLPPIKMHCSVLAEQALRAAIHDYLVRTVGEALPGYCPDEHHHPPQDRELEAGDPALGSVEAGAGKVPGRPEPSALPENRVLDCLGLYCPEPLFRARQVLEELPPGAVLEVLADDPAAEADLREFAGRNGHQIAGVSAENGAVRILLRKGSDS